MNLTDIAKKILNEDTWGNNPSAATPQAPGRSPTATQPPASPNAKMIDISDTFKNFKLSLEKQEDAAIKKLVDELSKQFLKKSVVVKASKGSVGQIEKEYSFPVSSIDIRYMKDKYYIVFSGKEGNEAESEYYLDDSQIEVDGYGQEAPTMQSSLGKGQVGGIKYPQTMGIASKRNIVPQN
jgi:hypothetical protein